MRPDVFPDGEHIYYTYVLCLFQYLSNAQDMENMIAEKMQLVSSQDYGRDENAADKLLTKHKVS